MVCRACQQALHQPLGCCSAVAGEGTYVDNILNLPKHGSDGLTNEWHGLEQSSLSDQDVQKSLVDSHELRTSNDDVYYLAERIEDIIARLSCGNRCHALHLRDRSGGCGHDVYETSDDLWEWSLSDDDQRPVDDGDALSRSLQGLGLLSDHVDVTDHLGWRELGDDWHSHSHG
jgi:hypothetical protein